MKRIGKGFIHQMDLVTKSCLGVTVTMCMGCGSKYSHRDKEAIVFCVDDDPNTDKIYYPSYHVACARRWWKTRTQNR